ncbi:hypothetical protein M0R01_01580 [bacterium]|nr:hypothetical protein [bacterium]
MVFYKCNNCNKKWQQPVSICPFCFSKLERIRTEKLKVIASSKVVIPSLLHPKIPYYALLIEDECGNKFAYKSMKDRRVGDSLEFASSDNRDAVVIWKANYDLLDAIENIVKLAKLEIRKDSKILVLPTLVEPVHNHFHENTSLEFLDAILTYLENVGVRKIKIATQSLSDKPIEILAQKSGLLDVCIKHKLTPFDLANSGFDNQGSIHISREVKENDLLLNLSALKSGKSSSNENAMRLIEKSNYEALRYLYSEEYIFKALSSIDNMFIFGEAIHPQRTDKFPVFRSLIFGSRNPVNLDAVFNNTGMVNNLPKYLRDTKVDQIKIIGREIDEVKRNIDLIL